MALVLGGAGYAIAQIDAAADPVDAAIVGCDVHGIIAGSVVHLGGVGAEPSLVVAATDCVALIQGRTRDTGAEVHTGAQGIHAHVIHRSGVAVVARFAIRRRQTLGADAVRADTRLVALAEWQADDIIEDAQVDTCTCAGTITCIAIGDGVVIVAFMPFLPRLVAAHAVGANTRAMAACLRDGLADYIEAQVGASAGALSVTLVKVRLVDAVIAHIGGRR